MSLQILIADLLQPVRAQAWLCQQVPPWEPHISGQSLVCQIVASEIFVKKTESQAGPSPGNSSPDTHTSHPAPGTLALRQAVASWNKGQDSEETEARVFNRRKTVGFSKFSYKHFYFCLFMIHRHMFCLCFQARSVLEACGNPRLPVSVQGCQFQMSSL